MSYKLDSKEEKFLEEVKSIVKNDLVPKDEAEFSDMALKYFEQQEHVITLIMAALDDAKKEFGFKLKDVKDEEKELYDSYVKTTNKLANDDYELGVYLRSVEYTLKKLNKTLEKYNEADNKTAIFIERKKAVHEIKKILRSAGKFQEYSNREFDEIDDFYSKM